VTNFTGSGISRPYGITAGPDGALWFTNYGTNSIGRITTNGTVTNYHKGGITGIRGPYDITAGPDGALWFTVNFDNNVVGQITTAGKITLYGRQVLSFPDAITAGPDGALWFTNGTDQIGRITTGGTIKTFSGAGIDTSPPPGGITAGPDGALWFTNYYGNSIGTISTSGSVTIYTG
jgi:virginiamycin B lyase